MLKELLRNLKMVGLSRYLGSKFKKLNENSRSRKCNKTCLLGTKHID